MNWQLLLDYVNRVAVQSLFSQQQLSTVSPCFGETLNLTVALLASNTTGAAQNQLWNPQSLSGWTIRAAIGQIGVQPVAGSFTLTYEAQDTTTETTAAIGYNASATVIAAALNAGAKMTAAGGCTVAQLSSGYFVITFNNAGPQFQITANAEDLAPESLIETGILIPGTSSPAVQCVQTFYILQNPAAYANLTTASASPAITCTALTVGSSGPPIVNATYSVTMNQPPYGGQFTLTIAGCTTGLLSYNAPPSPGINSALTDVQTALANLTQTSGALIVGVRYTIILFETSDNFSNVGGSNVTGAVFTASGTTPTNWSHGSALTPVGAGNVSVLQNSNGGYIVGFQGQLSGITMGTMTGTATSLQVIPTLGGTLSLATTGMQLLLGAQASVNAIFEIEGTPSGGAPVKLFRGAVTILAPVISPTSTTPSPLAIFYTAAECDARFGQLAAGNTWSALNTFTGGMKLTLGSDATGDIWYRNSGGDVARLGIGSAGNILSTSGGLPAWTPQLPLMANIGQDVIYSQFPTVVFTMATDGVNGIFQGSDTSGNPQDKIGFTSAGIASLTTASTSTQSPIAALANANTWTAIQAFTNNDSSFAAAQIKNSSGTVVGAIAGNTFNNSSTIGQIDFLDNGGVQIAAYGNTGGDLILQNLGGGPIYNYSGFQFMWGGTGGGMEIGVPLTLQGITASSVVITIQGNTSQTGDLTQWQNSGSSVLARMSAAGTFNATLLEVTAADIDLGGDSTGDIYYLNSGGALTRLGIGSGAQYLGITGGLPAWKVVSGGVAASAKLTAQSATVASVVAYTVPNDGNPHLLSIAPCVAITAISAGSLTITATFTDENSTSQTLTFFPMGLTSATLTGTGFTGYAPATIQCKANTTATLVATFTGVSITYDVAGAISQLT